MSATENTEPVTSTDVPMTSEEETKEAPTTTEEAPATTTDSAPAPTAEEAADAKTDKPKSQKKAAGPAKKVARGGRTSSAANGGGKKQPAAEGSKTFEVDQIVLARLKGYPPWPARIVDGETAGAKVVAQRPPKSTNHVCVQYFPKGDHSWLSPRDVSPLPPHAITAWLKEGHRKTGGLSEAYQTAQDPSDWIAGLVAPTDDAEEEEDELEEDAEEVSGGKRKRAEKKDKKKAAKANKKAKKSAEVAESEDEAPASKPKSKASKPAAKKEKAEPKAPENQPAADEDPLASDPEAVKVKDWRHKLQRAFLGKGLPSAQDMGTYDELFKTIESYDKMSVEYLSHSKIGKVMKKIATLDAIPRNDELKITDRASSLMTKWAQLVGTKEETKEANGTSHENGEANGETNGEKPTSKAE